MLSSLFLLPGLIRLRLRLHVYMQSVNSFRHIATLAPPAFTYLHTYTSPTHLKPYLVIKENEGIEAKERGQRKAKQGGNKDKKDKDRQGGNWRKDKGGRRLSGYLTGDAARGIARFLGL